jgi:hypothetical protein
MAVVKVVKVVEVVKVVVVARPCQFLSRPEHGTLLTRSEDKTCHKIV